MKELAAELDYSDELDVHRISLYNLLCTQIDFMSGDSFVLTKQEMDSALLNDPALQVCAGPERIDQLKYLHIIEGYLKNRGSLILVYHSVP